MYRDPTLRRFDPFPTLDEDDGLSKFSHHLKIGQRVIVKHVHTKEVHHGEISNITANRVHVLVDGAGKDGYIQCFDSECTPGDFPAAERPARATAAEMNRAIKASSPFPETLAKSAHGGFFVGQRVRDRLNGKFAKITAIQSGMLHVRFEDGSGEASSVSKFMEAA